MKKKIRALICAMAIPWALYAVFLGMRTYGQWQRGHGIPDLVGCISTEDREYLVMVAGRNRIEDREGFAREAIHMCQENAFHSIRFSTGRGDYPSDLDITVYLEREDVGGAEPFCKIRFYVDGPDGERDIRDAADGAHLYLDGEEIAFY